MARDDALTRETILDATESVLRRHGPAKATVLDVARVLGVSHGSVYRHFPSKAALRAAVTRRWLDQSHAQLTPIAESDGPPAERLRTWCRTLFDAKRAKVLDDPELFATYTSLADEPTAEYTAVIKEHLAEMIGQLARIIADGVAAGTFTAPDTEQAARAVFDATTRFHSPMHAGEWRAEGIDKAFDAVLDLTLRGLQTEPTRTKRKRG